MTDFLRDQRTKMLADIATKEEELNAMRRDLSKIDKALQGD